MTDLMSFIALIVLYFAGGIALSILLNFAIYAVQSRSEVKKLRRDQYRGEVRMTWKKIYDEDEGYE